MTKTLIVCLMAMGVLVAGRPAAAVTLNFEGLADLDPVTTQFAGLTFTNTTALISGAEGGSLNELEFPPKSGVTVVSDDGGLITISFDKPVAAASGFFTYVAPLTITALDALLAPVATTTSLFASNLAESGDPGSSPNELLTIAFAGGFSSLTLLGAADGASFALDDFTFVLAPVVSAAETPVPAAVVLATAALVAAAGWQRGRRAKGGRVPTAC